MPTASVGSKHYLPMPASLTYFTCTLIMLILAGCTSSSSGGTTDTTGVVTLAPATYLIQSTGTLPIMLSAPHGGTLQPEGIPVRQQGVTVLDYNTLALAQATQTRLAALTGKQAHLIAATISRKYIDFNRERSQAYEHPALETLYTAYHQALATMRQNITDQAANCALLVDIHGQSDSPNVTYRGTRNGTTANLSALYASGAFLESLANQSLGLDLNTSTGTENPDFNGGHIVATYGRSSTPAQDAVQLEFGLNYRDPDSALTTTSTRLANALLSHLQIRCPQVL
jgi:N-formylglutamate amidohydrolase